MTNNQVVKVRRDAVQACMTCPLCHNIFVEATTISECLHTFCRKCIYEKLAEEEEDCCPVCSIDLGAVPTEKLRPDHSIQDVRAKLFPLKKREVKTPEVTPTVSVPARRKERSLSSLVVNTPRVSTQTSLTGRRTKAVARRAATLRGSGFVIEEPAKKEEDALEGDPESSSSPETLSKIAQNRKQGSSAAEPSKNHIPKKDRENVGESWEGKIDPWKTFNFLIEAASGTKSNVSLEENNDSDNDVRAPKTKVREHVSKSKVQDEKTSTNSTPSGKVKTRKLHRMARKKAAASDELGGTAQAVFDGVGAKRDIRNSPIWFKLVASEDQEGDAPLPQISPCWLRQKDSNIPVSVIQKYLVKKLDLTTEAEVEIRCRGQPVVPTLELYNLMDLWLQTATTPPKNPISVGASAEDFVMELEYARRIQPS